MAGFRARSADPIDLQVVPFPAVTVLVDLGGEMTVADEATGAEHHGSLVVGMAPAGVRGHGRDIECLQLRLSPDLAHAVLAGAPDLTESGAAVPLDALWGRDADRVHDQLCTATTWDDRFALAEDALVRRLVTNRREVDPEVTHTWRRMVARRGQVRVDRLAAELGWSRKRLWSRFRTQVGLTPKRAAQLVRFDHAAHRLAAGHSPAAVAAEAGYADQSHLHRDALAFAGLTPTAVAAAPWLAVDAVAWPDAGPPHAAGA
jgi:AraC-like DNA-binding protein